MSNQPQIIFGQYAFRLILSSSYYDIRYDSINLASKSEYGVNIELKYSDKKFFLEKSCSQIYDNYDELANRISGGYKQ